MRDANGTELQDGDIVNVPCVVRSVHHSNTEWNNVTLTTREPNFPGQYHTELHLNAKQLEFVSREEKSAPAAVSAFDAAIIYGTGDRTTEPKGILDMKEED